MNKTLILLLVSFAMFMEAVDTTVINTAIPVMATSFKINPLDLKLALISYLLSLAIFIPISGWIADKFGIKKVFMIAVVIFTLSSVACGFAQNLWELIIARIVQGLGGSLTLPVGRLIIIRTCERYELVSKTSIVVMVAALGMMLGPVLGGVITEHFSWRWIFWVNAPIGLITFLFAIKFLPFMPPRSVPRLDKLGFVLFGSGLASLTFGLSQLSESHEPNSHAFFIIAIAFLLLLFYSGYSRHKTNPIVKVSLLGTRTFRLAISGNLFSRLGFGGMPFLLPLLLQLGLGFSPQLSGFLMAPIALGVLLVKPLSLSILRFFGYKHLLILNTFLVGLSLGSFLYVDQHTSMMMIALLTFFYGFLISLQYTAMNSLAYANLAEDDLSAATSMMSTIQQLAQSFGVAVAAILVRLLASLNGSLLTVKIFHQAFFALSVITLGSLFIFVSLKKEDGRELIEAPSKLTVHK